MLVIPVTTCVYSASLMVTWEVSCQFCAENFQKVFDKVIYIELQNRNLSAAKELYENIDCMSEIMKATFVGGHELSVIQCCQE